MRTRHFKTKRTRHFRVYRPTPFEKIESILTPVENIIENTLYLLQSIFTSAVNTLEYLGEQALLSMQVREPFSE